MALSESQKFRLRSFYMESYTFDRNMWEKRRIWENMGEYKFSPFENFIESYPVGLPSGNG
jgi:hypothetical protein